MCEIYIHVSVSLINILLEQHVYIQVMGIKKTYNNTQDVSNDQNNC